MTYEQALNYIHSLNRFGIKPGLERITALLNKLDNPQNSLKFIHVAGTNGKGSTSTALSNIMMSAGKKTGLFISPFVVDFRERIQINGEYIPKSDL
ncbi:MAG: bifunctional folylpolyglutamate synthase/dihydrofolate synthase, partial [Clostridia bacterium]|nr:bifunctional folylpolyglutamate synthase/dihydrofolate synthase [Clostridia bacterium]